MTESQNKKQIDPEDQKRYETALARAKGGDPASQLEVGGYLTDGVGVKRNRGEAARWFDKAFREYKKRAETGDAEGVYRLAHCYSNGTGVFCDKEEAVRLYRQAAEMGHIQAPYWLGISYDWNFDPESRDPVQAVYWYQVGAERGDPYAQYRLAFCCEIGRGAAEDLEKARYWYRKAAEQGDCLAMTRMGNLLLNGKGGEKKIPEALRYFRQAAEEGEHDAVIRLGLFYFEGKEIPAGELQQAGELAFHWLSRAAELFDEFAYAPLGKLYIEGRGVEKDTERGFSLVLDGAFEGDPFAQVLLGKLYDEGVGTERAPEKALEWWKYAAHLGSAEAQALLKERGFSEKDWAEPPRLSDEEEVSEDSSEEENAVGPAEEERR